MTWLSLSLSRQAKWALSLAFFGVITGAPLAAAEDVRQTKSSTPAVVKLSASQEALAQEIGTTLRCPVCQGMPIADSPAQMAQDMMRLVREKIASGTAREEIERYFVTRYGAWVLLRPPATGIGLWVWALPPAVLTLAIFSLFWVLRRPKGPTQLPSLYDVSASSSPVGASKRVHDWLREQGE